MLAAEVYPSLFEVKPLPGEAKDLAQVRTTAEHFARLDEAGKLGALFAPAKDTAADALESGKQVAREAADSAIEQGEGLASNLHDRTQEAVTGAQDTPAEAQPASGSLR